MLYKFWVRLGWIDRNTDPDDFDAFFEGKPRHCNITWTGNSTRLFFMLKELLLSNFIEKQSHCSATSMVKEQFLKTPNAGLLTGLLLGGLFAAALSGLLLMSGGLFDTPALLRMAAVLLCSCAGGVLGRALGEKKRRI